MRRATSVAFGISLEAAEGEMIHSLARHEWRGEANTLGLFGRQSRHGAQDGPDEEAITHGDGDRIPGQAEHERAMIESRGQQRFARPDRHFVEEFARTQ